MNQHLRETGQRVCVEMNLLRAEFANAPYQLSITPSIAVLQEKGGGEGRKRRNKGKLNHEWDH